MTAERTTSLVWALLMSLTILSWWLGTERASDARGPAVAILVVAFLKARLVIRHFMDVRHAPRVLRLATDVWAFGVCALLVGLFLFTG
jgi:caa(3)-type oxidase subunit IV